MKTRSKSLVYGVGVNDVENCIDTTNLVIANARWKEMIRRCYSEKFLSKNPSYVGCCVCDEWLYFSNFKKWFDENYIEGYALDKDLLVKKNKTYSPKTCCFIPKEINNLITKCDRKRGKYPIGVTKYDGDDFFVVRFRKGNGNTEYIGTFKNVYDAFNAYKKAKERYIKQVAEVYKNKISERVYNSLLNYKVEIND